MNLEKAVGHGVPGGEKQGKQGMAQKMRGHPDGDQAVAVNLFYGFASPRVPRG